ncbi:hypothetical protein [Achromobacter sp. ESBL13]|uniref:hypothetical protein n=1 Tax=Achromobacter sp. ESBL13 TaxID=3077328 RepID=UPI002FC5ED50
MTLTRTVLLHRLKTACYTISSIVLISWVTDALNEGLMFKPLLRYFYPTTVENYQHPFTDHPSLLIWLVPLLAGLSLTIASSAMAVHHLKRRPRYRLSPVATSPSQLVGLASGGRALSSFCGTHDSSRSRTFHALYRQADELAALEAPCATAGVRLQGHPLPDLQDMHQNHARIHQLLAGIRREAGADAAIAFDLSGLPAELASVATLAGPQHDVMLCQVDKQGQAHSYRLVADLHA